MIDKEIKFGEIVQLSSFDTKNPMFGGCLMMVTEV